MDSTQQKSTTEKKPENIYTFLKVYVFHNLILKTILSQFSRILKTQIQSFGHFKR
jgi:hypothetical protein